MQKSWESAESEVVGTVTLVYDHHVRMLNEKLTDMQHDHHRNILSTLHVHLDHDNCLEVLIVKGKAGTVQKIADALISTKGVKHGRLTLTTTGPGAITALRPSSRCVSCQVKIIRLRTVIFDRIASTHKHLRHTIEQPAEDDQHHTFRAVPENPPCTSESYSRPAPGYN